MTPTNASKRKFIKKQPKLSFTGGHPSLRKILSRTEYLKAVMKDRTTIVTTQNQEKCRLKKYFCEADKFRAVRWLKRITHKNLCLVGLSTATGRTRIQVCRNYELTWSGSPLKWKSHLINEPDDR